MKFNYILFLIIFCFGHLFAQNESKLLSLRKNRIYLNDKKLKYREFKPILLSHPASAHDFKMYKRNQLIASVFLVAASTLASTGSILGLLSAMEQADDIEGGVIKDQSSYSDGFPIFFISTVAFGIGSIPFYLKSRKQLKKSVRLYNSAIIESKHKPLNMRFVICYNGMRILYNF